MPQGQFGKVEVFEDFVGTEDRVASTAVPREVGMLRLIGQGIAEADSGAPRIATSGGGAVRLTTTNEDNHTAAFATHNLWDVATMGTIVMEVRVQFENLDTKEAFIGFTDTDIASEVPSIEGDIGHGATTTLTLTASDICGFLLSAELTDDEDWHAMFAGGATTGVTTSTSNDLDDDAVAGEWQILRLEIAPNGTARWYIDEKLKKTVVGAVSTTANLKFFCGVEAKGAAVETMDIDYIYVCGNRDWTV